MAGRRKFSDPTSLPVTRRRFLARSAGLISVGGLWNPSLGQVEDRSGGATGARVVVAEGTGVIHQGILDRHAVDQLFRQSLRSLCDVSTPADAWRKLLGDRTRIALKFNGSGAVALATHPPLAKSIVGTLIEAGYDPGQITAIELPATLAGELGVVPYPPRWTESEVDFGSGRDQFAAILTEIDALVNVTFLKHHNIAGYSACLKNLSHGLIKHPARFHGGGCSPYIADIVAQPAIRDALKLNIVNGLRVVFDRGPEPGQDNVHEAEMLIVGADPVATDVIALGRLDRERQARGLEKIAPTADGVPYLAAAGSRGLGEHRFHAIDVRQVTL